MQLSANMNASGSTLVFTPHRQLVPSTWRYECGPPPVPGPAQFSRFLPAGKRAREALADSDEDRAGMMDLDVAPPTTKRACLDRVAPAGPLPPAPPSSPSGKRTRDWGDAMVDVGVRPKRVCVETALEDTRLPAVTAFPWSRQQGWRDVVDAIPRDSSQWGARAIEDFDQQGPDVPLITMRELQQVLQMATSRAEAAARRQAEQDLDRHRSALEQQHLRRASVQPSCDYRHQYIS